MKKTEVLELLREEPEDIDIDKFIYTMWFRRRLEITLAQADEDEGISQEEFERLSDSWLE